MPRLLALIVFLCLTLTVRAEAPPSPEAQNILEKLTASYTIFDWDGAIECVEVDPPHALELARWMIARMKSGDAPDPDTWQFFTCFIARVLERKGLAGDLPASIEEQGLMLPESTWERSPLAAKPVEDLVTLEEIVTLAGDLPAAEDLARMGNYQAAYERVAPLREKVADYGYSGQPFPPELVQLTSRYQRLVFALAERSQELPVERTELELQRARQAGSLENEAFLSMLLLCSAARREKPDEFRQRLEPTRRVVKDGLPAFVVETWAANDAILRQPDLDFASLKRLHDGAWKHFLLPERETIPMTFNAACEAVSIWTGLLGARREPEARQLLNEDLDRVEKMAAASVTDENLEGALTLGGCLLDATEQAIDRGELEMAQSLLLRSQRPTVDLYEILRDSPDAKKLELAIQGHPAHMAGRWYLAALRLAEGKKMGREKMTEFIYGAVEAMTRHAEAELQAKLELGLGLAEIDLKALESEIPALGDFMLFFVEGATIWYEKHDYDRPKLTRSLIAKGRYEASQGRSEQAIADLTRAVGLIEDYLNELDVTPGAAVVLRERYRPAYELLARLQLEQGKQQDAFVTLARLAQVEAVANLRSGDVQPTDSQGHQAVETLAQERDKMAAANGLAGGVKSEIVARTRQEFLATLRQLDQTDAGYRLLAVRPVEFGRIQQSIPPDTAVIQLFPSEQTLYLFIATRENLQVREVKIARSHLEELVAAFRASVLRQSRVTEVEFNWTSAEGEALVQTLSRLYAILVAPLEEDVAGKRVLAFIPTDDLAYLPLASLARVRDGKLRFLAEDHPVVTLVNAADLTQFGNAPRDSRGSLLALGNPDGTLPGAQSEVQELKQFFPKARVFVGDDARWTRLQEADAQVVGSLHLATHGVLNARSPLDSYLVMAGEPDKVKISDVSGLELSQVGLVTLSACQTGLADRELELGQEIFSLSQGFGFAGVRSVMASLWKVDDPATRELMTAFYRELASGKSRAEALQAAQGVLLAQARYRHPFYWASFVLMGDWR